MTLYITPGVIMLTILHYFNCYNLDLQNMTIKLFQLNIYKGKYFEVILDYLKKEKFDIVCLQEVTSGKFSFNNLDVFNKIKNSFGYEGVNTHDFELKNEPSSYFGNAIFYSSQFKKINEQVLRLKPSLIVEDISEIIWPECSRDCLSITLSVNGKSFHVLTTHTPWTLKPIDNPEKIAFSQMIIDHIKTLSNPFILTGDFNMPNNTQVIKIINAVSRNLVLENNITNTLNPRTHRAAKEILNGLAVDYIFTSKDLQVDSFQLIDSPDLSDHYGLMVKYSI